MEYAQIKGTDIEVSRIGLGSWSIGGWMWAGNDERESVESVLRALDEGVNLIDTAPIYGFGRAEELVGDAISESHRRHEVVIATKLVLDSNGSKESCAQRIAKELEQSLKRLKTDYVDIYQVHRLDETVLLEDVAEVLERLFVQGKIRAIGVNNFSIHQIERFTKVAPVHTIQAPFNIFEREIEKELLPYCAKNNLNVITYEAICRGLLGGSITKETQFAPGDFRNSDPKFQDHRTKYLSAVHQLDEFAKQEYGKSVLELALRWLLDAPGITSALWGIRKLDQLAPLNRLMGWHLDQAALNKVNEIVSSTIQTEITAPPSQAVTGTTPFSKSS
jgi:aryl-alcohol dehydrogenase-like predicted oxidoreductase